LAVILFSILAFSGLLLCVAFASIFRRWRRWWRWACGFRKGIVSGSFMHERQELGEHAWGNIVGLGFEPLL
jgi:hypothetical protein